MPRRERKVRKSLRPRTHERADSFVLRYSELEIHKTALKHGVSTLDIHHATSHAIQTFQYFDEWDRKRILTIGPDRSGNMLELIATVRSDQTARIFHAMKIRPKFQNLINQRNDD